MLSLINISTKSTCISKFEFILAEDLDVFICKLISLLDCWLSTMLLLNRKMKSLVIAVALCVCVSFHTFFCFFQLPTSSNLFFFLQMTEAYKHVGMFINLTKIEEQFVQLHQTIEFHASTLKKGVPKPEENLGQDFNRTYDWLDFISGADSQVLHYISSHVSLHLRRYKVVRTDWTFIEVLGL